MKKWIVLAVSSVALASCGADPASERDNSGELAAEGEVLGGSISDAMIPVETVRSQSRTLRAAPEPDEEQGVEELFDAVVIGESDAPEPVAPIAAPPPAPEPAPSVEPVN